MRRNLKMVVEKAKVAKAPKLADPIKASIDVASQEMIVRSTNSVWKRFLIGL